MNVLVIVASGKTGSKAVERALEAGHQVTAYVRDPESYRPGDVHARAEWTMCWFVPRC